MDVYPNLGADATDKYFVIHKVITDGAEKKVGEAISHITVASDATDEEKAIANTTYKLLVDQEYCIEYNKKYITDANRTVITFEAKNEVMEEKGITKLKIKPLPLFRLD